MISHETVNFVDAPISCGLCPQFQGGNVSGPAVNNVTEKDQALFMIYLC